MAKLSVLTATNYLLQLPSLLIFSITSPTYQMLRTCEISIFPLSSYVMNILVFALPTHAITLFIIDNLSLIVTNSFIVTTLLLSNTNPLEAVVRQVRHYASLLL
jgi:hypothetical protein